MGISFDIADIEFDDADSVSGESLIQLLYAEYQDCTGGPLICALSIANTLSAAEQIDDDCASLVIDELAIMADCLLQKQPSAGTRARLEVIKNTRAEFFESSPSDQAALALACHVIKTEAQESFAAALVKQMAALADSVLKHGAKWEWRNCELSPATRTALQTIQALDPELLEA